MRAKGAKGLKEEFLETYKGPMFAMADAPVCQYDFQLGSFRDNLDGRYGKPSCAFISKDSPVSPMKLIYKTVGDDVQKVKVYLTGFGSFTSTPWVMEGFMYKKDLSIEQFTKDLKAFCESKKFKYEKC